MCIAATNKENKIFNNQLTKLHSTHISNNILTNIIDYVRLCLLNKENKIHILPDTQLITDRGEVVLSYLEKNGDKLVITVKDYSNNYHDYCFNFSHTVKNRTNNTLNTDWVEVSNQINNWSKRYNTL